MSSVMSVPLTDPTAAGGAMQVSDPVTTLPQAMQLGKNPMLPDTPLGAYTDSQYEAQIATLRNNIAHQYADLLQRLGYVDPSTNQFVQGSVAAEAQKQDAQLQRQQQLATLGVTQDAQRNGTLFSGIRGDLQARAEEPYINQRADLTGQTGQTLQQLYEQAAGLSGNYVLQQNQLLADAAARRASSLAANPPAPNLTAQGFNPAAPPPGYIPDPSGALPNPSSPLVVNPTTGLVTPHQPNQLENPSSWPTPPPVTSTPTPTLPPAVIPNTVQPRPGTVTGTQVAF